MPLLDNFKNMTPLDIIEASSPEELVEFYDLLQKHWYLSIIIDEKARLNQLRLDDHFTNFQFS